MEGFFSWVQHVEAPCRRPVLQPLATEQLRVVLRAPEVEMEGSRFRSGGSLMNVAREHTTVRYEACGLGGPGTEQGNGLNLGCRLGELSSNPPPKKLLAKPRR